MATLSPNGRTDETGFSLTIRPWMAAAERAAVGLLLPGCTASARSVTWVEVIYALNGAPLCYLRTLLQIEDWRFANAVDALISGISRSRWQSDCPQGELLIEESHRGQGEERTFRVQLLLSQAELVEEAEASTISFLVDGITAQGLHHFAAEIDAEITALWAGQLPSPAEVPDEMATYLPGRILNQRAYQQIQEAYVHDYLAEPFFSEGFNGWLATLAPHARLLDVGCAHGRPIAAALVERGFEVVGIDPSAAMIQRAQQNVSSATFRAITAAEVDEQEAYDGICTFFALLHMDPIELYISLHRLQQALKPGGHLLVVSGLPDLFTRTSPFQTFMERPVWEWHTSHEEITALLKNEVAFSIVDVRTHYPELRIDDAEIAPFDKVPEVYSPFFGEYPPLKTVFSILARKEAETHRSVWKGEN
jgi:2-polyprenyl-3-methyl-5-hydroxy-6-metoxy-1,4-benzoquinol methylase